MSHMIIILSYTIITGIILTLILITLIRATRKGEFSRTDLITLMAYFLMGMFISLTHIMLNTASMRDNLKEIRRGIEKSYENPGKHPTMRILYEKVCLSANPSPIANGCNFQL